MAKAPQRRVIAGLKAVSLGLGQRQITREPETKKKDMKRLPAFEERRLFLCSDIPSVGIIREKGDVG